MTNLITIIILSSIVGLLIYLIRKTTLDKKKAMSVMPGEDLYRVEPIEEEDYNGKDLFIKDGERARWESLTRGQKRKVLRDQDKAVASGRFARVEGGIITIAEAKKNGLV